MKSKKYWYFIEIWSCVICGKETIHKERKYTLKPTDPSKRRIWHDNACSCHF